MPHMTTKKLYVMRNGTKVRLTTSPREWREHQGIAIFYPPLAPKPPKAR